MRIAFADIAGMEISRPVVDDGWFPAAELEAAGAPRGVVNVSLNGPAEAAVAGEVRVPVLLPCDRCCRPVRLELGAAFAYRCVVGDDPAAGCQDVECRDADCDTQYLQEPVIEVGDLLREQIFLSLPTQVLCSDSCRGLCQRCGADLNTDPCSCADPDPSSPFSVLRELKNN